MDIKRRCIKQPLSKQPLALVLIQLRYTPINAVDTKINDIQEILRKDFPLYERLENISVSVSPEGLQQNKIDLASFSSIEGYENILLDKNQITFQVTDYPGFEMFYDKFERTLDSIGTILKLQEYGVYTRCGLRYVDQIIPLDNNDTIDSYLNENFIITQPPVFKNQKKICTVGVAGNIELTENKKGAMSVNIYQGQKGLVLPPDLITRPPQLKRDASQSERIGLIDMDASFTPAPTPEKYNRETVKEIFYRLHDNIITSFFDSIVSEEGIKKWK